MGLDGCLPAQFIQAQAANSDFENHLWISKVQAADGSQKEVLQYAQRVMMKFQQRFDCLNCAGVTAESGDGCLTACAGMDKVYEGDQEKFQGQTFNEIAGEQHRQCYSCTPKESDACAKTDGLIMWPHMQVCTLTRCVRPGRHRRLRWPPRPAPRCARRAKLKLCPLTISITRAAPPGRAP